MQYSETSDKGHSGRGQTSPKKDKLNVLVYTHSIENRLWKRTTSLQRTKWLVLKVSLLRGSAVQLYLIEGEGG